uniref:allantoinase n=1 Tax=Erpetoichthys calabaricus TaxID=27687 RepID=A0A8C4S5L2_ERPCA
MEAGMAVKVLKSQRVVLGQEICSASIVLKDGKIQDIVKDSDKNKLHLGQAMDFGDLVIMPGVIDSHVHVNEPGRTDWEGYWTATRSAAAGGITTIVDMPLNSIPPTTSLRHLQTKLQAAEGQCFVNTAFWGGVIPGNEQELRPMISAGVPGFKCFMIHSGVDEFPHVTEKDLHKAMAELQGTGSVMLFHAELELEDLKQTGKSKADPCEYSTFLDSRPENMEVEAVQQVCQLCLRYQVRCHIVHLSSAKALSITDAARKAGAPLTVETTHHYLNLAAEHIPRSATHFKCCPPIRSQVNQEKLWHALKEARIDMVVSDHSPCTVGMKKLGTGNFLEAWGGIASLQFGLPLFWTSAKKRGFSLQDIVMLLCQKPAELSSLASRKASLLPGYDADIVIWDPDKEYEITEECVHHKNKLTPYLGCKLHGEVIATIVAGKITYIKGQFAPEPPGQLLFVK